MRPVVGLRWLEFTEPMEGGLAYPYADIRGLITIAYGNLVDPMSLFINLPMMRADGTTATTAEKAAAWQAVKNDRDAARYGHRYAAKLTTLRLTREGMADLALGKLAANDAAALRRFPEWEEYPACCQLALHSLWWACGSAAAFPKLYSAVAARDFDAAAVYIHMNEMTPEGIKNAGLVPRNKRNKVLMRNASRVQGYKLDPDLLEWESDLEVHDAPTLPALDAPDSGPTLVQLNTPITTTADQPTIHPMPDTLDAWNRRDED
jgi:GH24 family phage-related lysozyme (muramidase)